MKEVFIRTLTGILFIILVIGSVLLNKLVFSILLGIFLAIAIGELASLLKKGNSSLSVPLLYAASLFMYLSFVLNQYVGFPLFVICFAILLPLIALTITLTRNEQILKLTAVHFFGVIYLTLPFGILVLMHGLNSKFNDGFFIISMFSLIWAYDTLAYCSGKLFGRHKLIERISPSKTWEGLIGGTLLTMALTYLVNRLYLHLDTVVVMGASVLVIFFSTSGDLFESALKRNAGVKDSGVLLPGHGGVLDRFDSVFFVVLPYIVYVLLFFPS